MNLDVGNSSRPHKANNSDGTGLSGTTHTKTKITKFSSFTVIRRCCINDNCRILKEGEKCGEFKNVVSNKKKSRSGAVAVPGMNGTALYLLLL